MVMICFWVSGMDLSHEMDEMILVRLVYFSQSSLTKKVT